MASSSAPPSKRSRKGHPDSSNPWFSSSKIAARAPSFANRSFGVLRRFSWSWLEKARFTFQTHLASQNLRKFLEYEFMIYPRLVRQFYANFTCIEKRFQSMVNGVHIILTPEVMDLLFDIKNEGTYFGDESDDTLEDIDPAAVFVLTMRDGIQWTSGTKSVTLLSAEDRMLLYAIQFCLNPKSSHNYGKQLKRSAFCCML